MRPSHFVAGGVPAGRLPVDRLVAPLVVISDWRSRREGPRYARDGDDILEWEKRYGRIPAGALVAMHAGWDARIGDVDRFLNRDAKGTMHAPGFSEESARFLVSERDICAVGVDTLSLDAASAQKFVAHVAFLGAGQVRRGDDGESRRGAPIRRDRHRRCAQTRRRDGRTGESAGAGVTVSTQRRRDAERNLDIGLGASATLRRDTRNAGVRMPRHEIQGMRRDHRWPSLPSVRGRRFRRPPARTSRATLRGAIDIHVHSPPGQRAEVARWPRGCAVCERQRACARSC